MDIFFRIFQGISEMPNIHPLIVHFPIALLDSFLLMELLSFFTGRESFRFAADWMLYLGTAGALGAVLAGLWAATTVEHSEEAHAVLLTHRDLGLTVLALSLFLSAWRIYSRGRFSRKGRLFHLAVAFIIAAVMAIGADKGGLMVYKYGVGVKAAEAQGHEHDVE
ncbi:MAG TPA: hypothetical protein DDW94_06010 [Deltaproteobacteria bacterium]|nr:MAG: hypothetical protein A2Z79_00545 [Deltaproteobacteria bacterium GWA2_55_82]OGQ64868.1 MAG: hypothetical protein A3I81_04650 [Deltaproteobacteria bacterium RIFCSPLOWO2_02_FULL_55_12]OIJ73935.1 MAG: hypothetical protein A2V21_306450 [Deltaproteobacteria bacterium GWC2_55_46]HBG46530.1 hypothetical protein [Deltaproteobacteria bacterium]HCY09932.1 hypothetical protein [Deltaproteobacteria bacterium]